MHLSTLFFDEAIWNVSSCKNQDSSISRLSPRDRSITPPPASLFVCKRFVAANEPPPEFRFASEFTSRRRRSVFAGYFRAADKWRVSALLSIRAPSAVCQLNGVQPRSAAVFLLICFFRFRLETYGFRARPRFSEYFHCGRQLHRRRVNYGRVGQRRTCVLRV